MKDLLGHEFEFDRFYRQCQWHIVSKSKPLYIDELHGFHNKNTFNKVLRMWNCCRGRSGGFVGERARSLYIYIYIFINIHKHSKGTLFNSPNGFQFLPIFAEGSLLKAHESTRKEAGLGEKTPR